MARPRATTLRRQYTRRLNAQLMREVDHISVDDDQQTTERAEETLDDLMKKYRTRGNDLRWRI